MWRSANRMPLATVIKVQRMALTLSPPFAARVAMIMVRLLLTRMNVISMTFRMLGENLKGSGQSGLAFLRKPYAKRMAPNVTASEMMNSHITNFLDGIENGDASSTPPTCPMVAWVSLTNPPGVGNALKLDPHHKQDVEPQNAHEVPVIRRGIHRALAEIENRITQLGDDTQQAAKTSEHVQRVNGCQHVEKGAVGIAGEIETLATQLRPGCILAGD